MEAALAAVLLCLTALALECAWLLRQWGRERREVERLRAVVLRTRPWEAWPRVW